MDDLDVGISLPFNILPKTLQDCESGCCSFTSTSTSTMGK